MPIQPSLQGSGVEGAVQLGETPEIPPIILPLAFGLSLLGYYLFLYTGFRVWGLGYILPLAFASFRDRTLRLLIEGLRVQG